MTQLTRRQLLQAAVAAMPLRAGQGGQLPNLVFIIADQHSGLALGRSGHQVVRTPRLDALARQGALFTQACTPGIICAPSRASLDTGLHVHTHGVRTNGVPLRPDATTIFSVLRERGYDAPKEHPHADARQYLEWLAGRGYKGATNPIIGPPEKASLIPTPYRFEVGRAGVSVNESLDGYTVQNAIRFLDQYRDRRFGLWVQLHGAHDPYVVPAPFDRMYNPSELELPPFRAGEYDSKPPRQKRTWQAQHADQLSDDQLRLILAHYYGMITFTDSLVGRLLDKLSELGLERNTIVVYTADHGDTMGYHRMFTKGFAFYEPSLRIPLIIRAPGGPPAGTRVEAPVSGIDVLPTVLELLGLPPVRNMHGGSLVPLWRGTEKTAHEHLFSGQDYEGLNRLVMVRSPEWKLTRYDEGGQELYNLREDPYELHNLANEPKYADRVRVLSRDLEDWDRAYPHARPRPFRQSEGGDPERFRRIQEAFSNWIRKTGAPVI